ncbi:MAG TPA: 50S ribosomal protein L11 methyltransferase [Bacillota bacterium]|nr:50S ribosomal protein L11 methyltransferase [Bacillota bacterium]
MVWNEIKIHTTYEAIEPISNILQQFDISGISIKESIDKIKAHKTHQDKLYKLNKHEYPETGVYVIFYLPKSTKTNMLLNEIKKEITKLQTFQIDLGEHKYFTSELKEEDWTNEWKKYYHSVKVTESIFITPIWEKHTQGNTSEIIVKLDPGLAFGTGTHPTTKLSIKGLEKYLHEGDRVIDVGCGSGVLSIVAAKLGAHSILSLDVDKQAVTSTKNNAKLNGVLSKLTVQENDLLDGIKEQVDIIVSNILAEVILSFISDAYRLVKKDGYFITSGIIDEKEAEVSEALKHAGFHIKEIIYDENWVSIVAKKCHR